MEEEEEPRQITETRRVRECGMLSETETLSESSRVVCSNTHSIVFHVRLGQVQLHYKILFIICCFWSGGGGGGGTFFILFVIIIWDEVGGVG